MKKKACVILKQIVGFLSCIAKAKSQLTIKSKSSAVKARLIMFSLVKSKKVLVSEKIHAILGHNDRDIGISDGDHDKSKAIVVYNNNYTANDSGCIELEGDGDEKVDDGENDDKYPDLRHTLFDEEEEELGGSIIELVKNSKDELGENFSLEDEIDHVADLFIMRFRKQMRLQKLESFKRFQEMLARSL